MYMYIYIAHTDTDTHTCDSSFICVCLCALKCSSVQNVLKSSFYYTVKPVLNGNIKYLKNLSFLRNESFKYAF